MIKTQSKRAAMSRVAGAGLVIGGAALSAVLLAGAPAQAETDQAHLGGRVWINTQGVNTVSITSASANPIPSSTIGDTFVGFPDPSIIFNTPGSTVVGLPGGVNVTGDNAPGNTIVWFPGGAIATSGSTFVF